MSTEELMSDVTYKKHGLAISDRWEIVWKLTNLVMAVFFLLAAFANHNDNDWYIWMPVYLLPAVLTIPIAVDTTITENKYWKNAALVHLVMCCAFCVYQLVILFEVYSDNFSNPLREEEGREVAGLLIIVIWLSVCRFMSLPSIWLELKTMKLLFLLILSLTFVPLFTWSLCYVGDWHKKFGHCQASNLQLKSRRKERAAGNDLFCMENEESNRAPFGLLAIFMYLLTLCTHYTSIYIGATCIPPPYTVARVYQCKNHA